ncbi:hypothetical protein T4B_3477 [Trichinella pseudospiralis]|uniref:Uncharacterized protein n=1 Tax=Trichinella pseudospiralis TaxID=6337 RepID=A0A0V1IJN6_TRIPS|nr:hypothetical protein T4A_11025 [Trichinella pseudospiralis]KRZ22991.1 hypothetical protein T4B_3477 [Trichinella pseudospiralis]
MFNRTTADGCTLVHGAELAGEDRFESSSSEARFIFQHSIHFQLGMMVQNEGNCICLFFLRIRRQERFTNVYIMKNMRMNKVDKSSLNVITECIITLVSSSFPSRVFEVALICLEFHEIKRNQGKNEITKQIQLAVY